ncbi:MAG: fibronectin type III domain-containing protein [Acidobacteria bacterium]|nr:fibronectin type III domain-containing protein [Acidobacteriota bacterium]
MNKNGVIAVVVVIAAIVLIGLWVMRSGEQRQASRQFDCAAPPPVPTSIDHRKSGDMVTLTWAAPTGADLPTTYVVEAGSAPGQNNQGTFITPGTATSFQRQAPPGTYYVRLFARNACGTSPASNEIMVSVP